MVNEVNGTSQSVIQSLNHNQKTDQLSNQESTSSNRSGATDQQSNTDVSLTSTSEQLNRLESQIRSQPAVDTQRVNQVRAAILDGSYQVDSSRVAEKLMQFEGMISESQSSDEA